MRTESALGVLVLAAMCLPSTAHAQAAEVKPVEDVSEGNASRIVGFEWVVFSAGKRTLPALRIYGEAGQSGCWIGDFVHRDAPKWGREFLPRLQGQDIADPEALWDWMREQGFPPSLMTAIDIAAWDLYGQSRGKPVAELLGPVQRDRVALYVAGLPDMTVEQNRQAVRQCIRRGIRGYKVYAYLKGHGPARDPGDREAAAHWIERDIALARAVHEAADGEVELMFYPGNSYSLEDATRVGQVLDELGYSLYFDPMPQGEDDLAGYVELQSRVRTPICGPIQGAGVEGRLEWVRVGAMDMAEIDLYAGGFTPCLRMVRACAEAGVPLDLHGGFPMDIYQFPLYGLVGDDVLPWLGLHHRVPQYIPVAEDPEGTEVAPARMPWVKRIQARPIDAEGNVRLIYEIPGMGLEPDWEYIRQNATAANPDEEH